LPHMGASSLISTTPPTIKPKKHSRRPTKTCYRWRPRQRDQVLTQLLSAITEMPPIKTNQDQLSLPAAFRRQPLVLSHPHQVKRSSASVSSKQSRRSDREDGLRGAVAAEAGPRHHVGVDCRGIGRVPSRLCAGCFGNLSSLRPSAYAGALHRDSAAI
jgi:hypothetical protein